MSQLFFCAIALMLVFEGLLPFLSPGAWRRLFEQAVKMTDGQIRLLGLASLLIGVGVLRVFGP